MEKINELIGNLKKNNIEANYFDSVDEAKKYILDAIGTNKEIGFGGSMSLLDMNLHKDLKDQGNEVHWHWLEETPQNRKSAIERSAKSDVYLTSTNAITLKGEMVNIDGTGNRVSAMIYGPKKVMIVCGINKISNDLAEGLERVRNVAAPPNSKRLNRKTPCAVTGECADCNSPDRICNVTTIIHKKPGGVEMEVVLIGENLGY